MNRTFRRARLRRYLLPNGLLAAGLFILAMTGLGAGSAVAEEKKAEIPPRVKAQMMLMTPERRKLVMALSPETRQTLFKVFAQHQRQSETMTLRQIMHELQADLAGVTAGIVTDNGEMAADHARRIADHRIPRGGILPYVAEELGKDETLSSLAGFNETIEGGARELAQMAEQGDMAGAAAKLSDIVGGCVACHSIFRGQPGVSANVLPPTK